MSLLDRMRAIGQAAVAKAIEQAPGVAEKALAFGAAAASVAAGAASSAYSSVRDYAAEQLKNSKFSDVDAEQAAGAMDLLQLGVANPDGTFRLLTDDERLSMARIILAATLEDDGDEASGVTS